MGDEIARELDIYGHRFTNVRAAFWAVMGLCAQNGLDVEDVEVPQLFRSGLSSGSGSGGSVGSSGSGSGRGGGSGSGSGSGSW